MATIDCKTERPNEHRLHLRVGAHDVHADLPVKDGGLDSAPGAHDYFDASLAACKALTATWYAKKNGIPLESVETHVESDSSEERSGKYKLRVRVAFHGPISEEDRRRLHAAVAKCPIHKLMTTSEITVETEPLE